MLTDDPLELLLDDARELDDGAIVAGAAVVVAAIAAVVGEAASAAPRVIGILRRQRRAQGDKRTE